MYISKAGQEFIKSFEKCRLMAYPDPKTGGEPWTVGWGETGPEITQDTVWTQSYADYRFEKRMERLSKAVSSLVNVELTQGQFDALCSFADNIGTDIDSDGKAEGLGDSTLLKLVNQGRFVEASLEFGKWISRGSPVEKGLRRRREAERLMFIGL